MLDTSVRLLRLLSLLQVRREWSGADLAARLDVTTRTVRNDVERLRLLGYEVRSRTGTAGGYRLAAGSELPPLLLDDDEAVAVAVGLQAAAAGSVTGIEETSVRALAKLEQSLPSRLRHRVDALRRATVSAAAGGPTVDAAVLTAVSTAITRSERLRFDYTGRDGLAARRDVEPHRLVYTGRRWYLLAWDTAREDWRTFRADRMAPRTPGGPRFTPREPPGPDVAQHVMRGVGSTAWHHRPRIRFLAPSTEVAARVTPTAGVLTGSDDGTCVLETGSDSLIDVAGFLATVDLPFEVLDPPELRDLLRRLADLYSAGSREPADRPAEPGAP
ncbi:helix-turn-helix transcriptional regulator [Oerskovia sp. NPDC060338]|uniref:helix-turn-helix transcriptional regulator n=1 Tax=Oerskovia sp. NPDC060338 TaxID=3347100 RepID=UPI00366098FA